MILVTTITVYWALEPGISQLVEVSQQSGKVDTCIHRDTLMTVIRQPQNSSGGTWWTFISCSPHKLMWFGLGGGALLSAVIQEPRVLPLCGRLDPPLGSQDSLISCKMGQIRIAHGRFSSTSPGRGSHNFYSPSMQQRDSVMWPYLTTNIGRQEEEGNQYSWALAASTVLVILISQRRKRTHRYHLPKVTDPKRQSWSSNLGWPDTDVHPFSLGPFASPIPFCTVNINECDIPCPIRPLASGEYFVGISLWEFT